MTRQSPSRESPDSNRVAKLARRPHRKSRNGCHNCKRRKVKCDEVKPVCANCLRFGIPCDFASTAPAGTAPTALQQPLQYDAVNPGQTGEPSTVARRGPGRPRKDWAALARQTPPTTEPSNATSPTSSAATPATTSPSSTSDSPHCSLNVADAELLLHFVNVTAGTLADSETAENRIFEFWSKNVPKIGTSYHFVLHLIYALAGYHLAHSDTTPEDQVRHRSLAEHHAAIGLSELNKTLPTLDKTNCGALYVSAVLVCFCTFASGPTGMNDLLICDVTQSSPQRWLPLIHGVRLIRQMIEPATLFRGLMEPLAESRGPDPEDTRPTYIRDGLLHIDWIDQLEKLEEWIRSYQNPDTIIFARSVQNLAEIYEAIYGNQAGTAPGPSSNQFVFGWLYRMQDPFVTSLRRKEPQALIILAYYTPLLKTLKSCWFLDGWTDHLLRAIRAFLVPKYLPWLQWPEEITRYAL